MEGAIPIAGTKWSVAGLLSAAYAFSVMDRFVLSIVLEPIKRQMALSDTGLALLHGPGFSLFYCVALIPLGLLADRRSRRGTILCGLLIWSLATIACAFAASFAMLLAARLALGIGQACLMPAGMSLIAASFDKTRLARATAIFTGGATVGAVMAFLGGGKLLGLLTAAGGLDLFGMHLLPWQGLFVIAGLPGLFLAALIPTIAEPPRPSLPGGPGLRPALHHFRDNLSAYGLFIAAFSTTMVLFMVMNVWGVSFYIRAHGLGVGAAGAIIGASTLLVGPAGSLLGGWILDRLTARRIAGAPPLMIVASLGLAAPPAALFCLAPNLAASVFGYGLLFLCLIVSGPAGFAGIQMLTPPAFRGIAASLFVSAYTLLSLTLGPVSVGLLSDHVFAGSGALGNALLLDCLLFCALGTALALASRQPFARAAGSISP